MRKSLKIDLSSQEENKRLKEQTQLLTKFGMSIDEAGKRLQDL